MFLDARIADAATDYDLLIVGGGPAGITVAHELAGSGLRIALLESGREEFDPDIQALYDGVVEGNSHELDLTAIRLRMWGGTSNHWGGHCTPLDPLDFARAPGTGLPGWPIGLETLTPYYQRAHTYCDLGRYEYGLDVASGLSERDLFLPEHGEIETRVLRQSEPTLFGEKFGPALRDSTDVHVWFGINATRVELTADGRSEAVQTRTLEGQERRFTAKAVVLACGAVETARLMLASNAAAGTAFGNRGDLLGRCYMDHPTNGAGFLHLSQPVPKKAYWADIDAFADGDVPLHFVWRLTDAVLEREGLPNFQYYVIPLSASPEERQRQRAANESVESLKTIVKWGIGRDVAHDFALSKEYCEFITNADSFAAETMATWRKGEGVDRLLLKHETEEWPSRDNYVSLGETETALGTRAPVVRWAPSGDLVDAVIETALYVGNLCGETGLGRLELEDHFEEPFGALTTSWHQLGTLRMAAAESGGVTDTDCRIFGTTSLYVAGGAVMPTCGRANPTLTIVALALRLADHLNETLSES